MHDLLDDRLLTSEGKRLTLPAVLTRLSTRQSVRFDRVRPHQLQGWYAWLVQVAALASEKEALPQDEATWKAALLSLAEPSAWQLVASDVNKPAFMQPPIPEGKLNALSDGPLKAPDDAAVDVLFTGRAHDLKPNRLREAHAEDWIFALVALQTTAGLGGRGNYGISRMNGGYSSRPMVGYAGSGPADWSGRFLHDLKAWQTPGTFEEHFDRQDGHRLLWVIPWDGNDSLNPKELHPAFIEIARRMRLSVHEDRLVAYRAASKSPRVNAKHLKGATGDIWTPVRTTELASLTVKNGFGYRAVHDLLFSGDWALPPSVPKQCTEATDIEFRAIEGGMGGTAGFHHRRITIPADAFAAMGLSGEEREKNRYAERSKTQLEAVKRVLSSALRPAIAALLQGAPESEGKLSLKLDDARIPPVIKAFESQVDARYFELLFRDPEADPSEHAVWFADALWKLAEDSFHVAEHSLPLPSARLWRARAVARSLLSAGLHKALMNAPQHSRHKKASEEAEPSSSEAQA